MVSYLNFAGGLRLNFNISGQKYGQAAIEYLQFAHTLSPGDSIDGIARGKASWTRLLYNYKSLHFEMGYWKGHNFYAPNGNQIFSNVSDFNPGYVLPERRIVTTSCSIRFFPTNSLELYLGVILYYDMDLNRMDQSYFLHLNFDKLISLASRKR